jgi:hypothetical protein
MTLQCRECRRLNPPEAEFCFYDGVPLANGRSGVEGASIDFSTWAFPRPFVFPAGAPCHNFLQLALACRRNQQETAELLQQGFFESFFGSIGRFDLALVARSAAGAPDLERGMDELLGKLPGSPLQPAKLVVEPLERNLGLLRVGEDRQFELTLTNKGDRLVHGTASAGACPWLLLGDSGSPDKLFQFFDRAAMPVQVRGKCLRANNQPQKAEITVESSGGNFTVVVEVAVPVKPFPQGVLSGATSPRQLAEKAKAHPKEAAVLLEDGSVARWYEANGWTYPVQGPTATGLAAVQQFFEMLGLVKIPKVELSETAVSLQGRPGERLEYVLTVLTQEKRPAVAHGVSDQPWLTTGRPVFRGQMASIPLIVEAIPSSPGHTLTAQVKVTGNGNQRFEVPVTLRVADGPAFSTSPGLAPAVEKPNLPVAAEMSPVPESETLPYPEPIEEAPVIALAPPPAAAFQNFAPAPVPVLEGLPPAAVPVATAPAPVRSGKRKQWLVRLLPLIIVTLGLLGAVARDIFMREPEAEPLPPVDYENPVLAVRFHDQAPPGDFVKVPSMRFGLGVPDPKKPEQFKTRLVFDEYGRTCNVCVIIDKQTEYLWGVEGGTWKIPMREPLGRDQEGHRLIGAKCTWVRSTAPPINITQYAEIVPGGLSEDGKHRLLDTCMVRYDITNGDLREHTVALRYLLDTFIGTNDAVPFTIAGKNKLCDTMETFNRAGEVPDYIAALEKQDVKNPGTVAYLNLKYGGGLEPPTRVTLGAWPVAELRKFPGGEKAEGVNTRWEVPVLKMELAKSAGNRDGDSAVTMYWDDQKIPPGKTRTVGFAYGLGNVSAEKGDGQLGLIAGGDLMIDKEFTLTAYVKHPAPGTTITLTLPRGLKLAAGSETETVTPIPPGSASPYSPVTWRVRAVKDGVQRVKIALNSGAKLQQKIVIRPVDVFK